MNLVYIAYLADWKVSQGVIRKITDQVKTWSVEHNVTLILISNCEVTFESNSNFNVKFFRINSFRSKAFVFSFVFNYLESIDIDIIYTRSILPFFGFKKILKNYKVVYEINSLVRKELDSKIKNSLRDYLNYFKNIYSLSFHTYLAGLVCVTNEIEKFENSYKIPSIVIPNGISTNKLNKKIGSGSIIPQLVFVGSPNQSWHGIEEILDFADKFQSQLGFHIVGAVATESIYSVENITFYPYMNDSDVDNLIVNFDIAICSASLYKKGMYEACPLKTRKYLSLGIPMIMPYVDTALVDKGPFEFICEIENKPNNLIDNAERIIDFSKKFKSRSYDIQNYNIEIDISELELTRLNFFKSIINRIN
ncbi:glycosyltransferase family protein [Algoriphagus namhaensis]